MALKSVDPVRKIGQGLNHIKRSVFSNGVESQNVEFKSNWWDEARGESCLNK